MGGAFRVACCVAASRGASATELACLRAPSQPRISVAAPTTSIIVTHNRVRFATRIPQRSSLDGASFFGRFFPFHAPCKALLGPGFARVTITAGGTFSERATSAETSRRRQKDRLLSGRCGLRLRARFRWLRLQESRRARQLCRSVPRCARRPNQIVHEAE